MEEKAHQYHQKIWVFFSRKKFHSFLKSHLKVRKKIIQTEAES